MEKWQGVTVFLGMAAMPFPLWSSFDTVDDSLASFTLTKKFGLLYMDVSLLFESNLTLEYCTLSLVGNFPG